MRSTRAPIGSSTQTGAGEPVARSLATCAALARGPPSTPNAWRATRLGGVECATPEGDWLGGIEQIGIDTKGRVSFATVTVGPMGGSGQTVAAVPWDALNFALAGETGEHLLVTLDSTRAQLELAPPRPSRPARRDAKVFPSGCARSERAFRATFARRAQPGFGACARSRRPRSVSASRAIAG